MAKGSLPLARCTVTSYGQMGFKICTSDNNEYEWTAKSVHDAHEWIEKIKHTAQLAKERDYNDRAVRMASGVDETECFFKHTLVRKNGELLVFVANVMLLKANHEY